MPPLPPLTAREVYQTLRDAALGIHPMLHLGPAGEPGWVGVDVQGWRLVLDFDGQHLHLCQGCRSPDGREAALDTWQRYGTDPVSLLSTWERTQLERWLAQAG